MARQRQLTPSTTGLRVHATRCRPLSSLSSHTVPTLRCRSSSGHCLAAHLRPVHKAMRDEGFATGTDSSCGWSSAMSVGPGFELGRWSFFSCHFSPEQCLQRSYYNVSPAHNEPKQTCIFCDHFDTNFDHSSLYGWDNIMHSLVIQLLIKATRGCRKDQFHCGLRFPSNVSMSLPSHSGLYSNAEYMQG